MGGDVRAGRSVCALAMQQASATHSINGSNLRMIVSLSSPQGTDSISCAMEMDRIARRLAVLAGEAAVAEVFGTAEQEQHATKGQRHHGDDEGEPAGVGVRAVDADAAEEEAGCE